MKCNTIKPDETKFYRILKQEKKRRGKKMNANTNVQGAEFLRKEERNLVQLMQTCD